MSPCEDGINEQHAYEQAESSKVPAKCCFVVSGNHWVLNIPSLVS